MKASAYDEQATNGQLNVIYNFGNGIIEEDEIRIDSNALSIDQFSRPVRLNFDNPYADMTCD